MENKNVISTINNLIETCKDGQNGFQEAAEGVERSDLKSLFYECSQQRAKFTGELQALVRDIGGEPEETGSVAAAVHRGWINIKSVVTGKDDTAILNECERGEDVAVKAYETALSEDLPANVSSTIQNQFNTVKTTHDKIKNLRDAGKAATT